LHQLLDGRLPGINGINILYLMSCRILLRNHGSFGRDGHLRRWKILHCIIIDVHIVCCRIVFSRCVDIELY